MTEPISLPASEAGNTPLTSPVGLQMPLFGLAPAPASPSALPDDGKASQTSATSGPSSVALSPSAVLQSSLESRLRATLDVNGSPEYVLTWKHWAMQSGPPICALRARARPISDNASTGWPTPVASVSAPAPWKEGVPWWLQSRAARNIEALAGWPTPMSGSPATESYNAAGDTMNSRLTKQLVGWTTPSARDWKDTPGMATAGTNPDGSPRSRLDQLPRQAATGIASTSSTAPTEKRGALNPAHSRWLMGFPVEWDASAAYGGAINPQIAATFVRAYMEATAL